MFKSGTIVAVTAHDAGAANLILGWLRDFEIANLRICVDGPARHLFSQTFPTYKPIALSDALKDAQVLLSGTSGASMLEHDSRIMAKELRVHSIGVIDHWVNYRERFIRHGVFVLPDELWVSDEYAFMEAKRHFPETPVHQHPNRYLEQIIETIQQNHPRQPGRTRILYVLEPIRSWGNKNNPGEFQSLEYFLMKLPELIGSNEVEIKLRPHPSEEPHKYDEWIARNHTHYDISLDTESSLAHAIGWSDWVVGCETNAMVVALKAGKRVYSSLPPTAPACCLPFPDIIYLARK